MNAYACFARAFAPRLDALLFESDLGERYTYADLDRETARVAAFLTRLGLQPGDRVAAQVDKSPQALFLYLGCLRAGLVFLPLNTAYQQGELGYFIGDAEPRVVVCRPAMHETVRALLQPDMTLMTLDEQGRGTFTDGLSGAAATFATVDVADDAVAVLIYTSGTTGRSKGAMVTHRNLTANAQALTDTWHITERDVLIHALPVFHVHGLFVAFHTILLAGAKILFHRKFEPAAVLRDIPRATMLMGVPTFYVRLLQEPGLTKEAVGHMRLFVSGSAPLLLDTFDAWRSRTGHTILERYGMSEAGMITSNPYQGERRGGTVGFALPGNRVRVRDGERECGPGEPGGIEISGPNVFAGYWRMPEKTREEFTADGWFRTGDVGQWSADGYLSIVGRAKDLVISGGYNVYPKEIELVIDAIPGVIESAVVGVPHPDLGEAVSAVVVKSRDSALDQAAVIAQVKAQIASYKVPKRVVFIDDLPRNAMGKVQKALLRELLSKEVA